ncbi:MAG: diguanylate cyclase [Chloroflexi bacterium]|nr:diguanylate cyclase [Chloroflexota bacterium]
MIYTPYLWLFIVSAGIILALSYFAWRTREKQTARAFLVLMLCALVWVVGFTFETAAQTLEAKVLFSKLEFLGITFLPNAWLFLAFSFAGQVRPRRDWILLAVLPTIADLMIWFVPYPNWFWGNPSLDTVSAPFPVLNSDYQFWFYYVHAPSGYIYVALAAGVVLRAMVNAQPIYRGQGALLLLAIVLPAATDLLYVLGRSPIRYYNFTSATFSISGVILAWNLFRFKFLNLLPLARDAVFENLSDGVIVLDDRNRIVDFNPSAKRMAELSASALGQPVETIRSTLLSAIEELQTLKQSQKDIAFGDSVILYYDLKLAPIDNRAGTLVGWVVSLRDVTDRTNLLNQVRHSANHDGLTGILNRNQLLEFARRQFDLHKRDRNHQLSYIILDLDDFKVVNDTYGHAAGDRVLSVFVAECQKHLRTTDVFGRTGGDEFAIVIPADVAEAVTIAERLREKIMALCIELPEGKLTITASLGLANAEALPGSDLELEKLIALADRALYRAKQGGKNKVVVQ